MKSRRVKTRANATVALQNEQKRSLAELTECQRRRQRDEQEEEEQGS